MSAVNIIDVAPRDGLQSEQKILSSETKVEFIRRLHSAGIDNVEATSFVSPKRVPQMADAVEVIRLLKEQDIGVNKIGLALNVRGCERAIDAGVDEVGFVLVSTDTYSLRNQGAPVAKSIEIWREIHSLCRAAKIKCNVTIASAFGCPFEGEVSADHVMKLAETIFETPPDTMSIADSIGVAVPRQIKEVLTRLPSIIGNVPVRCHLHDTRNTGIANALAAIEYGAAYLDASTGGIGGCPFAPAATGNIATEDLLYALGRSGIDCGVDIERVLETAQWLAQQIEHDVPSSLSKAGVFPTKAA